MPDATARRATVLVGAALLVSCAACSAPEPAQEQDAPAPPGFVAWRASELEARHAALGARIGADVDDVVPARMPHRYLPVEGGHVTYVLVRFPAVGS